MPNIDNALPPLPLNSDMWDELKNEHRPIVVYGMGNGADKLIKRFKLYDIKISDFFASDGFVRGHYFHDMRVKSFSEIKETYKDFVIVLSFASNREDVINMISDIDRQYDLYIPDMPVAGEDEYFDKNFYNQHYFEIIEAYDRLEDRKSKNLFSSIIWYKLTGRMKYLMQYTSSKEEMYSFITKKNIEVIIDAGAYNGDTAKEAISCFECLKKIYAIEPDFKNFKKLSKYSEAETNVDILAINAAAWSCNTAGRFLVSGNRNSSVSSTASFEHKTSDVPLVRIDSLTDEKIDYIKYDVEGAEQEALMGSEKIIKEYYPTLLISVYHRSRDVFFFINELKKSYPFYRVYLYRMKCLPAWELNLIFVADTE